MSSDTDIIIKIKKGDRERFGELYDKYIKKIYDFVYYKTTHKETAEDLTSQIFLKALNGLDSFTDQKDGTFSAWLYAIARNTVIDYYRTKKENKNIEDVWDLVGEENLERDLDIRATLEEVEKYLKILKPEAREIIIMRVWQELSYREIAEITGKTEASAKMQYSRAINKLRQEISLALYVLFLLNL